MAVSPIDYLLIGHLTADITPQGRQLGGTVAYAARTAAAFGMRVGVLTSAQPDEVLLQELRQWAAVVVIPASATTTFENRYTGEGRVQYIRGVAASLLPDAVPDAWKTAPLVHLAPIANEVALEMVSCFPDAVQMVTLQGWLRRWEQDGRVRIKRWYDAHVLECVDVVVFSEEDIAEAPDMEAELASAARHLIVTRAAKGGTYYQQGMPTQYTAFPAEASHPTGAGDIFAASFFIAWQRLKGNLERAVRIAAYLSAQSVTRSGLESAPTPEEIQQAFAS
ncbi:MAG: PfkB family carbohydrate kinase [bacterium]|nr:PfkB family carbohydrate kinase [bacterium]